VRSGAARQAHLLEEVADLSGQRKAATCIRVAGLEGPLANLFSRTEIVGRPSYSLFRPRWTPAPFGP